MKIILLVGIAFMAAVMDLEYCQVKNWLITAGLLIGLAFQVSDSGAQGLLIGLAGIAVPVICLGIFFSSHLLGAGDIKLFCVIGSFIGPMKLLYCIGAAFLLGGVMAALKLLICDKKEGRISIRFAVPILFSVLLQQGGIY
ncbi:MAG: prepilin peptidase [Lachnospiraceae bacterium]